MSNASPHKPTHITTEEAKSQKLPFYDVYRYTHLLYHDDFHRDVGVILLNREALKAFSDTFIINRRNEIASEQAAQEEWRSQVEFQADLPYPWGQVSLASLEFVNYENLKIASGFELHLKARLLGRGFVLHEIDSKFAGCKDLGFEQLDRPISKSELFEIHSYHFDGRQNYLPGLKEGSIKFSWMTDKPAYRASLGLSDEGLDIIRDYRLLRNQVHFPGDNLDTPNIWAYPRPIIDFLIDFINSEIICKTKIIIAQHKLKFPPMHLYE